MHHSREISSKSSQVSQRRTRGCCSFFNAILDEEARITLLTNRILLFLVNVLPSVPPLTVGELLLYCKICFDDMHGVWPSKNNRKRCNQLKAAVMKARTEYRKQAHKEGMVISTTHPMIQGTLGEKIDNVTELNWIIKVLIQKHFTLAEKRYFSITAEDEVYKQRMHFELSRYVSVFQAMSHSDDGGGDTRITPQMFRALFGLVEQYLEAAVAVGTSDGSNAAEHEGSSDDEDDEDDVGEKEKETLELRVMNLFRRMDYSEDGFLDFPEFLQLVSGLEENVPEMDMSKVLEEMGERQQQFSQVLPTRLLVSCSSVPLPPPPPPTA
jgi:hypothetical protein